MRKCATILTVLLFTAGMAHGQIFLTENEANSRIDVNEYDVPVLPGQGTTLDQYTPLGGGIMLLGLLGGAYLLGKKRKQE